MRAIFRHLSAVRQDATANVMPIAAAGMMVAVALVGSGVDMSRAYMVKSRLQAACDAGVLAGRRAVISNGFDDPAQTNAINYFKANFNNSQQGTQESSFNATTDDEGKTINGTATAKLNTAVMRVFAFNEFNLRVNCASTMGVGNSDIMMVLDTTGSMNDKVVLDPDEPTTKVQKISGLRSAMKNFYDTVEKSTEGSNARVRYGFVPYSSSVNVGKLIYNENPKYLVDFWEYQTRYPDYQNVSAVDEKYTPSFDSYGSTVSAAGLGSEERYDSSTEYTSSSSCNSPRNALNNAAQWTRVSDEQIGDPQTVIAGRKRITTTTLSSEKQSKRTYKCVSYKNSKNQTRYYINYYDNFQIVNQYRYDTEYALLTNTSHGPFDHWNYTRYGMDVSLYKTGAATSITNGNNANSVSYTWKGCIEERGSVATDTFSYSPATGITPSQAYDLNIDLIPSVNNEDTKWAPMWPEIAYLRGTYERVNGNDVFRMGADPEYTQGKLASSYCPIEAQLLSTMTKVNFYAYADKLKPEGSTYHDLGIIWGGRLSSPDGIFSDNVTDTPQNGGAVSRHMIFMTDGIMDPSNTIQTSYGIEYYDRKVTNNGSSGDDSRHTSRFLAVCEAVKAKGIRLWVVAFGTTLTTDLQECASEESAFTANDAGSLNSAFQEIAKQVGELRVMQ